MARRGWRRFAARCCGPQHRIAHPPQSQANLPHRRPRAANPLAPRGLLSPYRPHPHAVFVLLAAALRTCRAAQSPFARRSEVVAFSCVSFLPCVLFPPFTVPSCPLPLPGDRLEGPFSHNGFYSRLPAIPVALISNRPCSPVRCTLLLGSGGRTPQAHMPASISLLCLH
jgi:hypothetical protein